MTGSFLRASPTQGRQLSTLDMQAGLAVPQYGRCYAWSPLYWARGAGNNIKEAQAAKP